MKRKYKITVENNSEKFKTLMLEPWGEDYGMMPKDAFEIIETEAEEDSYFHIAFEENYILVYAEGSGNIYPRVYQNGIELLCGHNRK
jgi:hypothetical protein